MSGCWWQGVCWLLTGVLLFPRSFAIKLSLSVLLGLNHIPTKKGMRRRQSKEIFPVIANYTSMRTGSKHEIILKVEVLSANQLENSPCCCLSRAFKLCCFLGVFFFMKSDQQLLSLSKIYNLQKLHHALCFSKSY